MTKFSTSMYFLLKLVAPVIAGVILIMNLFILTKKKLVAPETTNTNVFFFDSRNRKQMLNCMIVIF